MIRFCSLYSGSSGNSIFLESTNAKILIDAGVSGKKIEESLLSVGCSINQIDAIIISHEHSDHVSSVGHLSKKYDIPVYASKLTWEELETQSSKMNPGNIYFFEPDKWFSIGNIDILPFSTPHDAVDPCGFNIFVEGKKVTIATDIGHVNNYLYEKLEQSDLLFLESNHDPEMLKCSEYPWFLKRRILGETGHLCNEDAAKTIVNLAISGVDKFFLGHLSAENNFPELAMKTVSNSLEEIGVSVENDIFLEIAPRFCPSTILELG